MNIINLEDIKERFWLTKEEARIITNFTRIHLLFLDKELKESFYNENDINELLEFTEKLDLCVVCAEINDSNYKHIKPLVDLEVDRVFFNCFCKDNLFNSIDEKIAKYEKYNKKRML